MNGKPVFDITKGKRILIFSLSDTVSQSQIFPFHFFLQKQFKYKNVQVIEVNIEEYLKRPELSPGNADVVCFQTWINKTNSELLEVVSTLRQRNQSAKMVFLDPFAPTDLRYAKALDPVIDIYVKKHVLRNRDEYNQATNGDTNLSHWYGDRYGLLQRVSKFDVPANFFKKLVVGPSFATACYMLPDFLSRGFNHNVSERPFDVHARIGGSRGDNWYARMRSESLSAAQSLQGIKVTASNEVSKRSYFLELLKSKICFSPFGYGEVCWRDFESVHSGSVLLKPNMNHVETFPDIFLENISYMPISWDFSDLQVKSNLLLRDSNLREYLSKNAYGVLHDYARSGAFFSQMKMIFSS